MKNDYKSRLVIHRNYYAPISEANTLARLAQVQQAAKTMDHIVTKVNHAISSTRYAFTQVLDSDSGPQFELTFKHIPAIISLHLRSEDVCCSISLNPEVYKDIAEDAIIDFEGRYLDMRRPRTGANTMLNKILTELSLDFELFINSSFQTIATARFESQSCVAVITDTLLKYFVADEIIRAKYQSLFTDWDERRI